MLNAEEGESPSTPSPAPVSDSDYERALHNELERRIGELGTYSDDAFGHMGIGDAALISALFIVAPMLLVWLFR